ncbi:MAG: MerR family transcriptional regulator [Calditrichaceae bacterium]
MEEKKGQKNVLYPIGMVAKIFDISVATLRLYEAEGLIIPRKSKGGHRLFTEVDLDRIHCIRDMIDEKGLNLAGIRMMLSAIPCWELKPCSLEERQSCDAYYESNSPCWMVENKAEICANEDCSQCPVYTQSNNCTNIKMILKKYWRAKGNG